MNYWFTKFQHALRGVGVALRDRSFMTHLPPAIVVLCSAVYLGVNRLDFILLIVCITLVLSMEMMNSALEHLARQITSEKSSTIGAALDLAAAAVLVVSFAAVVVGTMIFVPYLSRLAP